MADEPVSRPAASLEARPRPGAPASERRPSERRCPECDADNPVEATYCGECGTRLDGAMRCAHCDEAHTEDARFCENCGAALAAAATVEMTAASPVPLESSAPGAARPPISAERRAALAAEFDRDNLPAAAMETNRTRMVVEEGQVGRTAEHRERFANGREEYEAIARELERAQLALPKVSAGNLRPDPQVRLWKCNFVGALHFGPRNCAHPEQGGEWVWISQDEFKKLDWFQGVV